MYHYVRDLENSRYSDIKGLSLNQFRKQLDYLLKHYTVIRMEDVIDAIKRKKEIPKNSLLLTFDDAYKDHFEFVFPILDELNIQGSFFIPAQAIVKHKLLDVNKIHFILASVEDKMQLVNDIYSLLDKFREEYSLESNEYYFEKLAVPNRFDTKEVIFIKRILQRELPEKLRNIMSDELFKKYVFHSEKVFAKELYLRKDQIKLMKRRGMYIGSHGFDHYWLNTLTPEKQEEEINLSLQFLKELGCNTSEWAMCYPYGAYNDSLIEILKKKNCVLGLSTKVDIADLNKDDVFSLPRLDTNDFPKESEAPVSAWTLKLGE